MRPDMTEELAAFARAMAEPYDPDELLHRLVVTAGRILDAVGAGIMLAAGPEELRFVAATDDRIAEAEVHQSEVHEGTCYEAYMSGSAVVLADMTDARARWPRYVEGMQQLGLCSGLGIPLRGAGATIGVLNVYRDSPGPWSDADLSVAQIVATMATGYVLNANQQRDHASTVDHLMTAIASRDTIGQAKGILMSRFKVDADTAFELMRARSQRTHTKLRDVAAWVVAAQQRDARRPAP